MRNKNEVSFGNAFFMFLLIMLLTGILNGNATPTLRRIFGVHPQLYHITPLQTPVNVDKQPLTSYL